jgi:hypothetical protein
MNPDPTINNKVHPNSTCQASDSTPPRHNVASFQPNFAPTGFVLDLGDRWQGGEDVALTPEEFAICQTKEGARLVSRRMRRYKQATVCVLDAQHLRANLYYWCRTWTGLHGFTPEEYDHWDAAQDRSLLAWLRRCQFKAPIWAILCLFHPNYRRIACEDRVILRERGIV